MTPDPAKQQGGLFQEGTHDCEECRSGGYVYRFNCPRCVARWALRLPTRDMRRAAWKAHPAAVWLAVIRQVGFHRGSRPNERLYASWLSDYSNKFPAATLAEWQAAERVIARAAGIDSLGDVRDR